MGDIADYYYDQAMQDQWEYDEMIADELKQDNDTLVRKTKMAKKPLIVDIRRYYKAFKKLSEKQRYRLAEWIVLDYYNDF